MPRLLRLCFSCQSLRVVLYSQPRPLLPLPPPTHPAQRVPSTPSQTRSSNSSGRRKHFGSPPPPTPAPRPHPPQPTSQPTTPSPLLHPASVPSVLSCPPANVFKDTAPLTVKLYLNRQSMGFSDTDDMAPAQSLELTAEDLVAGSASVLKFVKFQRVTGLSVSKAYRPACLSICLSVCVPVCLSLCQRTRMRVRPCIRVHGTRLLSAHNKITDLREVKSARHAL